MGRASGYQKGAIGFIGGGRRARRSAAEIAEAIADVDKLLDEERGLSNLEIDERHDRYHLDPGERYAEVVERCSRPAREKEVKAFMAGYRARGGEDWYASRPVRVVTRDFPVRPTYGSRALTLLVPRGTAVSFDERSKGGHGTVWVEDGFTVFSDRFSAAASNPDAGLSIQELDTRLHPQTEAAKVAEAFVLAQTAQSEREADEAYQAGRRRELIGIDPHDLLNIRG